MRAKLLTSIRVRLITLFVIVYGGSLVSVAFVSYRAFVEAHQADFDAALYNHGVDVASAIDAAVYGRFSLPLFAPEDLQKRRFFPIDRSYMQIRDRRGEVIAQSDNLRRSSIPITETEWNEVWTRGYSFADLSPARLPPSSAGHSRRYRVLTYLVQKEGLAPMVLQIAAPMTLLERSQQRLVALFSVVIPLALAISAMLGLILANRAFRPVRLMTNRASRIQVMNLTERLVVPEGDSELQELGDTLNQLLSRVERAVRLQERFIADASHQLKTPLAILKSELELLEVGHTKGQSPGETRGAIQSISQEVTQLIRLVENLLLMAKMDAGHGVILFQDVRLDELVMDVVAKLTPWARAGSGVRLKTEFKPLKAEDDRHIDFEVRADPDLLRSLLNNLIENAVKYSEPGGDVVVRLEETERSGVVEVQDFGRGIDPAEQASIFGRFHRNPEIALKVSGSGLGLPIAKRIAELHEGSLSVASEAGKGSTFRFEMKKPDLNA